MTNFSAQILEKLRSEVHQKIDTAIDEALNSISSDWTISPIAYKTPTLADGHDPRNKNGQNLTPRGIEILYRVFDEGGGYNRASKMLNIAQGSAKNRKALWTKSGGMDRKKQLIDIDTV